jgi:hypothetical protein
VASAAARVRAADPPGVPRPRVVRLGRCLGETRAPVLPYRLEQPVARLVALLAHVHERLLDEPAERAERVRAGGVLPASGVRRPTHLLHRLQWEGPAEHAQSGPQRALGGAEQVVAPVEQRAERLVARQGGAPPAREHGEHVV